MVKKIIIAAFLFTIGLSLGYAQNDVIKLIHTTDIHGNFFPFDFINNKESKGGFARVSTYINEMRKKHPERTLLLDGGDLLQGQPCVYYSNFIDTVSPHLCAQVMNYIGYDAVTVGNHDIEAGHAVYDRWIKDCKFPVLGANVVTTSGQNYLPSYTIFERGGVKIAVIGMITKAIPAWLPENLWSGLRFEDIEETALKLIPEIKEKENPDVIVGLFHTGVKTSYVAGFKESVGLEVAQNVPGFDIILCGHDHSEFCEKVVNKDGSTVLLIDPANGAYKISEVTIEVKKENGKVVEKNISGEVVNISDIAIDQSYMEYFSKEFNETRDYVNAQIGEFTHTVSARDAWFGPSAFVDLLHTLQLNLTGADLSLVAPLSLEAVIPAGKVYMRDMFNLYRYENLLYTMTFSGKEIKDALEYSYGLWTNQMKSPDDHLLLLRENTGDHERSRFVNPFYSFDSAAGIIYTVDVTKPIGERVHIEQLANGQPFDEKATYRVAVNSYQGSGGGSILTDGAGIEREKLSERVVFSTDKDLRYYLAEEIKKQKVLSPKPLNQWKFIPEEWAEPAVKRDYQLLFGE